MSAIVGGDLEDVVNSLKMKSEVHHHHHNNYHHHHNNNMLMTNQTTKDVFLPQVVDDNDYESG